MSQTCLVIHDSGLKKRWDVYLAEIKQAMQDRKSALLIFADTHNLEAASRLINEKIGVKPLALSRQIGRRGGLNLPYVPVAEAPEAQWVEAVSARAKVAIGVRSAVFAPLPDLGLIIVDEEQDSIHKQDQSPHYHARDVALMRARINGSRLVLASSAPSLEAMRLVKVGKSEYTYIPLENPPSVRIIDTRRLFFNFKKQPALLSRPLEDAVLNVVKTDGRVLFFLNRKGFATRAQCSSCGKPVLCPRCNSNLIYLYKEKALKCTHCVYSMPVPQFCPQCSAGYLKFSGWGAQKLESELSRLFPAAKNIHVETSSILRREVQPFDLVAAPDIDSILNLSPYSSSYEVFLVLSGLMRLAKGSLVIQTANPNHHAFRAITAHSPDIFYQKEFSQRRQGGLPPFKHILLVKVRSPRQDKAKSAAEEIYNRLNSTDRPKGTTMLALKRAELEKLRGNFYWNIVISASKVQGAVAWLKKNLRKTHRSGIIVTVDVDPV